MPKYLQLPCCARLVTALLLQPTATAVSLRHEVALQSDRDASACFAAYAQVAQAQSIAAPSAEGLDGLSHRCPQWRDWVSTDAQNPDKVHIAGAAVILGHSGGNATTGRYGSIADVGVDLGGGFSSAEGPHGTPKGVHLLSIPAQPVFTECCSGQNGSLASAIAEGRDWEVCPLLHDGIKGALAHAGEYALLDQAVDENDEHGFSQCYHRKPEVAWLHLHTTAGARIRESAAGSRKTGLGPRPYNACVCEPTSMDGGHGSCPSVQPRESAYVSQAVISLCQNVAAAAGVADSVCASCASVGQ